MTTVPIAGAVPLADPLDVPGIVVLAGGFLLLLVARCGIVTALVTAGAVGSTAALFGAPLSYVGAAPIMSTAA